MRSGCELRFHRRPSAGTVSFPLLWRDDRRVVRGPHSGGPSMNGTAASERDAAELIWRPAR